MLHRSLLASGGLALIAEITNADCLFVAERSCGLRCTLCYVPCARLTLEFRRRALHQPHDPGKAADGAKKSAVVGVALTVLADVRNRPHWDVLVARFQSRAMMFKQFCYFFFFSLVVVICGSLRGGERHVGTAAYNSLVLSPMTSCCGHGRPYYNRKKPDLYDWRAHLNIEFEHLYPIGPDCAPGGGGVGFIARLCRCNRCARLARLQSPVVLPRLRWHDR